MFGTAGATNELHGHNGAILGGRYTPIFASTRIFVIVALPEIRAAFLGAEAQSGSLLSLKHILVAPERVKRAMLEPLEPLTYRAVL